MPKPRVFARRMACAAHGSVSWADTACLARTQQGDERTDQSPVPATTSSQLGIRSSLRTRSTDPGSQFRGALEVLRAEFDNEFTTVNRLMASCQVEVLRELENTKLQMVTHVQTVSKLPLPFDLFFCPDLIFARSCRRAESAHRNSRTILVSSTKNWTNASRN